MSFVKNIFQKMSVKDDKELETVEDSESDTETEESTDTGIATSGSDLDSSTRLEVADCSAISNFFGYWKNLINQEAKFQSQLNDLSKQLSIRDAEANKLRFQMEELQRDVFAKSAGMDRLQTELQAALKESENFRQRLKHVEDDLESSTQKNCDLSSELTQKTERFQTFQSNANTKITELQYTIRGLRAKIESLEIQLEVLEKEKENLEKQKMALMQQREEDKKTLDAALEKSIQDKTAIEEKWKLDFEKLRTVGIVKEQELLDDFEWKLREIEQSCKKRLQEKDKKIEEQLKEVFKDANKKVEQAEQLMKEVENLKSYECEVKQLRGLTEEQQKSLDVVSQQLQEMKHTEQNLKDESKKLRTMVDLEKENLQHMQRMHNREIVDKEKALKEKLAEQKTAIAIYWEERLLQECRRLKSELDQLHYEERFAAIEAMKSEHESDIEDLKEGYEKRILEYVREVNYLKTSLTEKDEYYKKQIERIQSNTDRDIMELRRVMDKIDMSHHERFEKLVQQHEEEIDKINSEHEKQMKDAESSWHIQLSSMRTTIELVKEQMEHESQEKIQSLIDQHRAELDAQWENLIRQKNEAIILVEEEYVTKLKTLEDQFYTQQKSHQSREVELLKAIDSLKNEIISKNSAIEDLQSNVDTLEGGIQVLHQEMAYNGETANKIKMEADYKIRGLHEEITKLQNKHTQELEEQKATFQNTEKDLKAKIDHLERKCQCVTKLFEEIRSRYERRESRQEDLNVMSDLRQVIAEQEKDLACLTEEKRYFQMKLMTLEQILSTSNIGNVPGQLCSSISNQISVPATIPECEDDFEDAVA
uniref:Protein FAM184A/B N-terminal domain-containing protein n=1 Tax=Photinus pyralis TaxID=7054 RepID=A0A1Y1KHN1_PHOPY